MHGYDVPYYKVDNTQVVYLLVRFLIGELFLFLLNLPHELLRLFVLACHDVGDAQVGQDYCRHAQYLEWCAQNVTNCVYFLVTNQVSFKRDYMFLILL